MNGFFGYNGSWIVLYSVWIGSFKRQFYFGRTAIDFVARCIADRRTKNRRNAARREGDAATLADDVRALEVSPVVTGSVPVDFARFKGARLLTAKSAEALTINIDRDAVVWLSQQDVEYQERVNRMLRRQMRRANR